MDGGVVGIKVIGERQVATQADMAQALAMYRMGFAAVKLTGLEQNESEVGGKFPANGYRRGEAAVRLTPASGGFNASLVESASVSPLMITLIVICAVSLFLIPVIAILGFVYLNLRKKQQAALRGALEAASSDLEDSSPTAGWRKLLRAGTPIWTWLDASEDQKVANQVRSCIQFVEEDEAPVCFMRVSVNLSESAMNHDWMFVTTEKIILGMPSKLKGLTYFSLDKRDVVSVGVGETAHTQQKGFVSTAYSLISLTISTRDNRQFVRHFNLGANEKQFNIANPAIIQRLTAMRDAGYVIVDGPGWNSVKGYTRSVGYGIINFRED